MSITQDQFNMLLSRIETLETEIEKLKSKSKSKSRKEVSLRHTDEEFDMYIKEYIHFANVLLNKYLSLDYQPDLY